MDGSARRGAARYFLAIVCASIFALGGLHLASAQDSLRPGQMIELKEQLETGLRARLPSEFDYLDSIVTKVNTGQLPQSLVRSTFVYARKQRRYPIRHFDQALRIRAKRQGITGVPILKVDVQ